jgi:nitrate reductase NapE component
MIYLIFKREKKVIAKFKNESTKSREIGNLVVICYVIFTIVSFILVIK